MPNKKKEEAQVGVKLNVEVKHYDSYEEAVQKAKEFNEMQKTLAEAEQEENEQENQGEITQ